MGFSVPPGSRRERWALTPPFHPYHSSCKHEPGRFVFCGTVRQDASRHHFPRVSPSHCSRLRGIAPFGVRTFLPLQVAPEKAILRLSKIEMIIARGERSNKAPLRLFGDLRRDRYRVQRKDVAAKVEGYYPGQQGRRGTLGLSRSIENWRLKNGYLQLKTSKRTGDRRPWRAGPTGTLGRSRTRVGVPKIKLSKNRGD